MVCGDQRGLEPNHRFLAAVLEPMAARAEIRARSDQTKRNDSGSVARTGSSRSKVAARSEARQLVFHASWQEGAEEFALSAGFPKPGGAGVSRSGDRTARQRIRRRLHQDGLQR